MKGNKKSRICELKEGSRAFRRHANSQSAQKKVMEGFKKYAADCAANRPKYVADFLGLWQFCAENVRSLAEFTLDQQYVELTEDVWKNLISPYGLIELLHFVYLMDRLELEEEERFLAIGDELDHAWQQFFSTARMRHPSGDAVFTRLETARQTLHNIVVPFFTGETEAVLRSNWANAYMALDNGHKELSEALLS